MDSTTLDAARLRFSEDGFRGLIAAGLYRLRIRVRDCLAYPVGKAVELRGDTVEYHGVTLSLDNPTIKTRLKSRFVYGTYEADEVALIDQYLPHDRPVVELGGCIGFTACYTNAQLSPETPHVVVEANSDLIRTLEHNRNRNGATFTVEPLAYSSDGSAVTFNHHSKFVGGSAQRGTTQTSTVEGTDLETLLDTHGIDTCSLIVDIEGGEFDLIDAELRTLQQRVDTLLIEFHDFVDGNISAYQQSLESVGFVQVAAQSDVVVYRNE